MDRFGSRLLPLFCVALLGCPTDSVPAETDGNATGSDGPVTTAPGTTSDDPSATGTPTMTAADSTSASDASTGETATGTSTGEDPTGTTGVQSGVIPCQPSEGPVVVVSQAAMDSTPFQDGPPDIMIDPLGGGGGGSTGGSTGGSSTGSGSTGGSTGGGSTGGSTGGGSTSFGSTSFGSTSGVGSSEEDTGVIFIIVPDTPLNDECDVWDQDCPAGEKCNAWANDGGTWNALRCVPVADNPNQVGDACSVQGNGSSGFDDCDFGSMCWDVDPETNMGTCVELCSGSPAAPVCDTVNTTCTISNMGVLILCQPICNPLADECPEGQACYPVGDTMVCAPDVTGMSGAPGDPCEFINVCDLGTYCAPPDAVPGCVGGGCCSPFCEVGDDSNCLPGQMCVPFYPDGAPAECLEAVGACAT
ncbi:MAG: hypothetical protein AAF721_16060 [Myxococcota bacterium]